MCILFIYQNPDAADGFYKLILASNRDEYYIRPSKPAHFWHGYPGCLGGMDMEPGKEGGTWLAINIITGRAGIVLNLSGEQKANNTTAVGRGNLIKDYLISQESTLSYMNKLHKINQEQQLYNPYNLVLLDLRKSSTYYLSSILNSMEPVQLEENLLGFGNSAIDRPYKKVQVGVEKFQSIVKDVPVTQQQTLIDNLLQFLKWDERHLPDTELQKRMPRAYEELSSVFVTHKPAGYGTRTHTILFVDTANRVTFVEETLMPDGTWKCQSFNTKLE